MEVLRIETWKEEFSEEDCDFSKLQEYLDFISLAIERYDPERYSEWHHIMPKSIDRNLKYRQQGARINGADHFKAHLILYSCFKGKLKSVLSYALMRMKYNVTSHGEEITPEDWELAVSCYAKENAIRMSQKVGPLNSNYGRRYRLNLTEEQRERKRQMMRGNDYGKYKSEESRKRMSEKFQGEGHPFYGKKHTEETRHKISEGRQGDKNPAYKKVWMTNGEIDRRVSEEEVDDMIKQGFRRGRLVSDKARKRMSESQSKRSRDQKGRWI